MTARDPPPFRCFDGFGISDPFAIGLRRFKLTIEPIRRKACTRIALGDRLASLFQLRAKSELLHQSHDPFARAVDSPRLEHRVNAGTSVDLAMVLEDLLDFG